MTEDQPEWYDESKIVNAQYAEGYGGYVVDLGDGTCRFVNDPMLGEDGPSWGDRVDLFYNPCMPFERPHVGYRIYPDGEEPTGRNFGIKREPDDEEREEHERIKKARHDREMEELERRSEERKALVSAVRAESERIQEVCRYQELRSWVTKQGMTPPDDLHEIKRDTTPPTPQEKREHKAYLLAVLESSYSNVTVTREEIDKAMEDIGGRS